MIWFWSLPGVFFLYPFVKQFSFFSCNVSIEDQGNSFPSPFFCVEFPLKKNCYWNPVNLSKWSFISFQSRLSHLLHEEEGSERLGRPGQTAPEIRPPYLVICDRQSSRNTDTLEQQTLPPPSPSSLKCYFYVFRCL